MFNTTVQGVSFHISRWNGGLAFLNASNEERLKEVAQRFAKEDFRTPDWRAPVFLREDTPEFIDFLGVGNSINFCFQDLKTKKRFRTEYQGQDWEGAFGMWASLKRALEEGIPVLDAQFLAQLDLETTKHIFRGETPLPMIESRQTLLQETGISLLSSYGSFSELFRTSGFRAFDGGQGIVEQLVAHFPSYYDSSGHNGHYLDYHKRANLFVLMYQGRALASEGKLSTISDAQELTPPADYEVPKALKFLGILKYPKDLERMVKKQRPIFAHSTYEIEIRAQTVFGMVRLAEEINKLRSDPISVVELDYKIWSEGKNASEPHHLTETTAY